MSEKQRFEEIINSFPRVHVLVIGDVMLDIYEWCDVKRVSPEAPILIANTKEETFFLGGAANVAHNARALDAKVTMIGVVGDDQMGEVLKNLLAEKGIEKNTIFTEAKRPTTSKRRIISGSQQLLRVDREVTHDISSETSLKMQATIALEVEKCDVIILSDYCKGALTDEIINFVKTEALKYNKKIFVDSKNKNFLKYKGVYLVKPNKEEAEQFAGEKFEKGYTNLKSMGQKLSGIFQSNIVITLAGDGTALFEGDHFSHKLTKAQQVFDVSGAGDTVMTVVALAVGAGAKLEEAVDISNIAAGYVVSRVGTTVCSRDILNERLLADI
ncbi:MAG: bifunctional ADP-heptose synthase [Minisyncoccia bacterium]